MQRGRTLIALARVQASPSPASIYICACQMGVKRIHCFFVKDKCEGMRRSDRWMLYNLPQPVITLIGRSRPFIICATRAENHKWLDEYQPGCCNDCLLNTNLYDWHIRKARSFAFLHSGSKVACSCTRASHFLETGIVCKQHIRHTESESRTTPSFELVRIIR